MIKRRRISITGQVQGVGFRPAVYRIARSLELSGIVYNDTKGVTVELQGEAEKVSEFLSRLQSDADKPPLAVITSCDAVDIPVIETKAEFVIETSDSDGAPLSQVTADIATCRDCLAEMADEEDFRYGYPFINCTNCGPRYSIVKTIPYDRPNTTMSVFEMCGKCSAQYTDVNDRRFHAQPVACGNCGPQIRLTDSTGETITAQTEKVIAEAARLLLAGKIVAIKGIGGFHLAADALNSRAVQRLRRRKKRDHKPFAMMTASIEQIEKYAIVNRAAGRLLSSPQSPIVLLPRKPDSPIAPAVAEGVDTYGFMLCYAPLHYLLFAQNIKVLVMTSGNISDEPLICKNEKALERLGGVADAFLMHDRKIYRQVNDSILHFVDEQPAFLRRARGYVPTPIIMKKSCRRDIFAAGADLKNTFCFAKQNQLICSEHIGDLEDAEVYHHYIDSIEHLRGLFEVEPKIVACDLHPGYLSTRYALLMPDVKIIQVQHHWAHIASVLAEHNLEGPVIGIVADGTGYGTDGAIWGCECLIASLEKFERFGHLSYYSLAGGDKASKEAIRPAVSLLKQAYGADFDLDKFVRQLERTGTTCHSCEGRNPETNKGIDSRLRGNDKIGNIKIISEQLEKGVNCVETSSLGRVFDAVAAMLGLGSYNHFDAQLPMALEAIIESSVEESYDFELINTAENPLQLDLGKMIRQIIDDIQNDRPPAAISAKFHNTIAAALMEMAKAARESTKLNTVALSGGVFCNRYLINRLVNLLKQNDFTVLFNRKVPSNDGGISLGQAAIAARIMA
ncbi:MAG TPA: carbamoyltransferase HypF [Sedimentisphaerales bacterium]|nr:carbamoyltransferase HypF [Sedimentisphaerales bacterium]